MYLRKKGDLMNNLIYLVEGKYLNIVFDIEYQDLILNRMISFQNCKSNKIDAILKITKDELSFKMYDKQIYKYLDKIDKNDLFVVINNAISYLCDTDYKIYIHSCVVSDGKNGCLILGDFGSGKTTLALECKKNGMEINSADQTFLELDNNKIIMIKGSKNLVFQNQNELLSDKETNKRINIKKIIFCIGLCYNGDVSFNKITQERYFIKKMFDRSSFHFKFPLITNNEFLPSRYKENINFIKNIAKNNNVSIFTVRGDPNNISKFILKKLGSDKR